MRWRIRSRRLTHRTAERIVLHRRNPDDTGGLRRKRRRPLMLQEHHQLGDRRERSPFIEVVSPYQRVLADRSCLHLVGQLFEGDRSHGHVVDRHVPFRVARSRGNHRRQRDLRGQRRRRRSSWWVARTLRRVARTLRRGGRSLWRSRGLMRLQLLPVNDDLVATLAAGHPKCATDDFFVRDLVLCVAAFAGELHRMPVGGKYRLSRNTPP